MAAPRKKKGGLPVPPVPLGPLDPKVDGGSAKARITAARLAAAQVLYQAGFEEGGIQAALQDFLSHRHGFALDDLTLVPGNRTLLCRIVLGVAEREAEIDGMLSEALKSAKGADAAGIAGKSERVDALIRAILRGAVFELLAEPETPMRVILADWLSVTDAFYGKGELRLVNGVLDAIARLLRPEEAQTA
jgi:N utilization substance protein B